MFSMNRSWSGDLQIFDNFKVLDIVRQMLYDKSIPAIITQKNVEQQTDICNFHKVTNMRKNNNLKMMDKIEK